MPAAYALDPAARTCRVECTGYSSLDDLAGALSSLRGDPEFQSSFGLLLELNGDGAILAPTHAVEVVKLLAGQGQRLRGPVAVCVPATGAIAAGRLIAMLGQHYGLDIEPFHDRRAAADWLASRLEGGRHAMGH
jgi:hypothetical protein